MNKAMGYQVSFGALAQTESTLDAAKALAVGLVRLADAEIDSVALVSPLRAITAAALLHHHMVYAIIGGDSVSISLVLE